MDTPVPEPSIEGVRAALHAQANAQHLAGLRAERARLTTAHAAALRGAETRWSQRLRDAQPEQATALAAERDRELDAANAHWLPQIDRVNVAISRRMNSTPVPAS